MPVTKKNMDCRTVTCLSCGIKGTPEQMAHVGENAYKCVYCLFTKVNKEKR